MSWHELLERVSKETQSSAVFKQEPEDFVVKETLSFPLTGEGEHLYVLLEKKCINTELVVKILSKKLDIKKLNIGYAGLKDKQSISRQWFSLQGINDVAQVEKALEDEPEITVIDVKRHQKKLRKGAIESNQFSITLRQFDGCEQDVVNRLNHIKAFGFPNYFGPQRFGRNESNIKRAQSLLRGEFRERKREKKYFLYSVARSFLFNKVLSERIKKGLWSTPLIGDLMNLEGSKKFFSFDGSLESSDEEIVSRLKHNDIHITGPLVGRQGVLSKNQCLTFEMESLKDDAQWLDSLQETDVDSDRRALRALPRDLSWAFEDEQLHLTFKLSSGMFATSLLREVVKLHEPERENFERVKES